jgi:hypothetical protein
MAFDGAFVCVQIHCIPSYFCVVWGLVTTVLVRPCISEQHCMSRLGVCWRLLRRRRGTFVSLPGVWLEFKQRRPDA